MPEAIELETYDGDAVTITLVDQLTGGGMRVDLDVREGPRWRLDVARTGTYEIVTSWNADDQLADVETPAWIDDVLARLQRV